MAQRSKSTSSQLDGSVQRRGSCAVLVRSGVCRDGGLESEVCVCDVWWACVMWATALLVYAGFSILVSL